MRRRVHSQVSVGVPGRWDTVEGMTHHSTPTAQSSRERSETVATTAMLVASVVLFVALALLTPLEMIPRMLITLAVAPVVFSATRALLKRGRPRD